MENFKPGDVVMLKSGSPAMTITYLSSDGKDVYCVWYDPSVNKWNDQIKFLSITLKIVE